MVASSNASGHLLYFAYGSNMWTARLRKRTPSCEPFGIATLTGYSLRFHKRSGDGSAKGNAFATGGDESVIGVLFGLDPNERGRLDEAEGLGKGYDHATVTVVDGGGHRREALTYLAAAGHIDESRKPYTWYNDLVLAGSAQHGLPAKYIFDFIQSVEAIEDPKKDRDARERAILEILD